MTAGVTAVLVLGIAASPASSRGTSESAARRTAIGPDFAVYLQSWSFVSGEANLEAVWRIENHGPASEAPAQGILSLNTPGLSYVPPSPGPGCDAGPATFATCSIPVLASGASWLITTRVHAADTSYFVVQMHVNVPGAPAVLDANSADNDASLGVVPPLPPSGGGGQIPTLTFEAIAPEVVFNALLDLCNVQVGSEGLVRANLGPEKSRWVIRYPNGTTTDETTPYLPSWFLNGFPVGTTRITVTATALSGPSPAPVSFSVIVRDRQAPTFLATGSVVANATSHRGARVAYPYPATLDNCGGVRVKGNPSPGTVFPIGTTHVVATATDPSGNTAKLSFDVVVKGAHEQFVAVRRAAESVAGNRARPKADAAAIERLLRDPRDKVQSRACDPLGNLQRALAPPAGNPTARRAEVITSLTRIRHVLSC